jgi:alginate O-acetyltransferase complex protein AlgI
MALLLDYRAGRLPKEKLSLRDAITYALFFPAFTAGPIDRVQRFAPELQQAKPLDSARLVEGGTRIAVGVFKKFIIADSLALVAMKPDLIERANGVSSLWILVYLYSLQIFFDFSGYSDVAIGLGRLYGITLPENFDRPYIQRNLQQFWQRWHITLSTWFRVYWFTPFSRTLIRSAYKIPQWVIVLLSQLTTMFLIGMWHGVTLNFAVWGLWHGVGLFLHKTLADNTKSWLKRVNERAWSRRLMYVGSVFVTFHFVTLGWVFFDLPHVSDSLDLFLRLFGLRA